MAQSWARAWSEKRVEDYLWFYSKGFEPPGGLNRESWKRLRRRRVSQPGRLEISLVLLGVEIQKPGYSVKFLQDYRSDSYSDVVTKTLVLVREDGLWKIARELVE